MEMWFDAHVKTQFRYFFRMYRLLKWVLWFQTLRCSKCLTSAFGFIPPIFDRICPFAVTTKPDWEKDRSLKYFAIVLNL